MLYRLRYLGECLPAVRLRVLRLQKAGRWADLDVLRRIGRVFTRIGHEAESRERAKRFELSTFSLARRRSTN